MASPSCDQVREKNQRVGPARRRIRELFDRAILETDESPLPPPAAGAVHGVVLPPLMRDQIHPPSRPIRGVVDELRHLHQVEHAGESEWTPLLALVGLVLFFGAIGLLIFGIVEGAFHLLASGL